MKKPNALASALRNSGANVAASSPPTTEPAVPHEPSPATAPSRRDTKAITVHFPEEVRRQLKSMAAEEGRSMEDMIAEALNLLFVRYRRAELAPRKSGK
jgi:hypothetical protein